LEIEVTQPYPDIVPGALAQNQYTNTSEVHKLFQYIQRSVFLISSFSLLLNQEQIRETHRLFDKFKIGKVIKNSRPFVFF